MPAGPEKAAGALRTIGEVSAETGLPQHILRYWETRFAQLRPITRAGRRRYYRPEDLALVRRLDALLNKQGYTVRGVQNLLASEQRAGRGGAASFPPPQATEHAGLAAIRARLVAALAEDFA